MKAVIVEVRGKFAAALSNDATVVKVKNRNYVIGQVIEMTKTTSTARKLALRVSAIAAAFVLTFGLGAGSYAYFAPNSYVSMDVNPSIEYTLNMFDRVLNVTAVNEDGAQILQEFNLKDFNNKTIDEVIKLTLAEIDKEGYFNGDVKGGIVIATSGKDHTKAEELAAALGEIVKTQCKETGKTVKVETLAANQQMVDEAKALGVTPGKLRLVQELQEDYTGTEPFDAAAWLKKPVKDIMAEAERLDALEDALEGDKDDPSDTDDVDDPADPADPADDKDDAQDDLKDAEEDKQDAVKDVAEKTAAVQKKLAEKKAEAAEKAKDAEAKKLEEAAEAAEKLAEAEKEAAEAAGDTEDDAETQTSPDPKPTTSPDPNATTSPDPSESPEPSEAPESPEPSETPEPSESPETPEPPKPTKAPQPAPSPVTPAP